MAVAVVAATAVAIGLAALWLRPRGNPGTPRQVVTPAGEAPQAAPALPPPPAPVPDRGPQLPAAGRATVRAALDRWIAQAGLAATLDEADRDALMTALARLRRANRARHRTPDGHRRRLERYARIAHQADELFVRKLGVHVYDFIAAQGAAGNVDDLGRARE